MLLEDLQRRCQPVQNAANVAAHDADAGAVVELTGVAVRGEITQQTAQRGLVEGVGGPVQGDGDVGLRRGDQIDAQTMGLEADKDIGQEADLLPHADRLHGDEGDVAARADRLDRGGLARGGVGDDGAGQLGVGGGPDVQGDPAGSTGRDRCGVQDLCAGAGDLLGLVVVEGGDESGGGHLPGVGGEHAGHVGPDLTANRGQACSEGGRGGVASAPSQQHGLPVAVPGDEALGDDHREIGEACDEGLVPVVGTPGGEEAPGSALRQADQEVARIHPLCRDALGVEPDRTEPGGHQLTLRHHPGRQPRTGLSDQRDTLGNAGQLIEHPRDPGHLDPHLRHQDTMFLDDGRQDGCVGTETGRR